MSSAVLTSPAVCLDTDQFESELTRDIDGYATAYRAAELPRASLDSKQVKKLLSERHELNALCERLGGQIKQLEADTETGQLYLNYEPLLQRLGLYDEILRICDEFKALAGRLEREQAEVKEACIALAKQIFPYHLPKFEQGLESFQDRCDSVADQLDSLENKGHDIAPLVRGYEVWIALVERFSEILDERTEALKPAA